MLNAKQTEKNIAIQKLHTKECYESNLKENEV